LAYTTIIKHKKLIKNDVAIQVFTERGPLAFLPLSSKETSIVFSARGTDDVNLRYWIEKYGKKYTLTKVDKIEKFEIKSNSLRIYYHKNILAFGDLLHQIHPLAGQGFNMTLRDIKVLTELIQQRISNGLDLNSSVCSDFQKEIKHKNYLFSSGVDFIYEFFNKNQLLSNSIKFLGKNKIFNRTIKKFADIGMTI
jgi:2-octaprenyl-6-methoxyphenol hydroxylase